MELVNDINQLVGSRIRELRRGAGLTQEELAEAFGSVPTLAARWRHRQTVGLAERGARSFTAEDLVGLAAFFGVPIAFLFDPMGNDSPSPLTRGVDEVIAGRTRIPGTEFHQFIDEQIPKAAHADGVAMLEEPGRVPQTTMTLFVGPDEGRPWANHLRKGHPPGEAYLLAREEHIAMRERRLPGPTIRLTGARDEWSVTIFTTPWTMQPRLTLLAGKTYTARDDIEAEHFLWLVDAGIARRVRPKKTSAPEKT